MVARKTPQQKAHEVSIVRSAIKSGEWMRPLQVAEVVGCSTGQALAALMRMQREGKVERREYYVPRIHHGKQRTRNTVRLIVEYRLITARKIKWPSWLMPSFTPPKNAPKLAHRLC